MSEKVLAVPLFVVLFICHLQRAQILKLEANNLLSCGHF